MRLKWFNIQRKPYTIVKHDFEECWSPLIEGKPYGYWETPEQARAHAEWRIRQNAVTRFAARLRRTLLAARREWQRG